MSVASLRRAHSCEEGYDETPHYTKSAPNLSICSVFRQQRRPSVYLQFWAKSFAAMRPCSSSILSCWSTVSEQLLTRVYPPFLSLTLPRYFWLPPWAVPYFKDEQRCFVFIYLFLLFSIYYSFVPPSAARRQAGWADVMELAGTVVKQRRSFCWSPSRSGLDVLLALERRDHYLKLVCPCIVVLNDLQQKSLIFNENMSNRNSPLKKQISVAFLEVKIAKGQLQKPPCQKRSATPCLSA